MCCLTPTAPGKYCARAEAKSVTPIIFAEHLAKTFKSDGAVVHAVRDISLHIEAGELFGLFGHNGAGKSTLVRMLATLVHPTHGSATINGFDLIRAEQQVRASIGLVASDERSFYGRLSGGDNLRFFAALQNVPRRQIDERAEEALRLFDLQSIAKRRFQTYSTGQRQRLNMARAILHDPPVLFLDEPTKSMDVQTSDRVKALVKNELVARKRKTVVFISHELYEMENFCDRVAVVHQGKIRALGTPAELLRRLPAQHGYEVQLGGDIERVLIALRAMPQPLSIDVSTRGESTATVEIHLAQAAQPWNWQASMTQTVVAAGGHVELLRPLGGRTLRDVISYFTTEENT
jgi:ABC-2 type transport system ATP-binding protein